MPLDSTSYSSANDRVQVQVSTNGTTWTNVGTAVARYTGSTGWAQASIDLSAYKGKTVYLADQIPPPFYFFLGHPMSCPDFKFSCFGIQ
jgi:hypothetical protein